tara:strand:- start:296 stop:565 length:270 start_codon:yes stop_codon:yes gene_type:complete
MDTKNKGVKTMSLNVLLIANVCGDYGHIASTIDKKQLTKFVQDKGYSAVEYQNKDYSKDDTVERLRKEFGYYTLKTLPESKDTIGYGSY